MVEWFQKKNKKTQTKQPKKYLLKWIDLLYMLFTPPAPIIMGGLNSKICQCGDKIFSCICGGYKPLWGES